jgi:hypothetical protein
VRKTKDTYINTSQGGIQIGVKCLDIRMVSFCVDSRRDESAHAESSLNELWVIPQGLCES